MKPTAYTFTAGQTLKIETMLTFQFIQLVRAAGPLEISVPGVASTFTLYPGWIVPLASTSTRGHITATSPTAQTVILDVGLTHDQLVSGNEQFVDVTGLPTVRVMGRDPYGKTYGSWSAEGPAPVFIGVRDSGNSMLLAPRLADNHNLACSPARVPEYPTLTAGGSTWLTEPSQEYLSVDITAHVAGTVIVNGYLNQSGRAFALGDIVPGAVAPVVLRTGAARYIEFVVPADFDNTGGGVYVVHSPFSL